MRKAEIRPRATRASERAERTNGKKMSGARMIWVKAIQLNEMMTDDPAYVE